MNKIYIMQCECKFNSKKCNFNCFQEEIGYEDFKDLTRGTADDRALCDKAFNIAKN